MEKHHLFNHVRHFKKNWCINLLYECEIPSRELTVHIPPLEILNHHRLESAFREKGRNIFVPTRVFFLYLQIFRSISWGVPVPNFSFFRRKPCNHGIVVDNLKGIPKNSTMELQTIKNTLLKKKKCCRDFQLGKQKIRRKKNKGTKHHVSPSFQLAFLMSQLAQSHPPPKKKLTLVFLTS